MLGCIFAMSNAILQAAKKGVEQPPAAQPPPVAAPKRNYDEAKIQIRLQDGKKLEQIFKAKEPLRYMLVLLCYAHLISRITIPHRFYFSVL